MRNMQECIGKSCELDTGDIAFMLGNICYSLSCASNRVCETIPAKPYALHTKLAFLRWAPKINETGMWESYEIPFDFAKLGRFNNKSYLISKT